MNYYQLFVAMITKLESSKDVSLSKKVIKSLAKSFKKKMDDLANLERDFELKRSELLDEFYDLLGKFHCHWTLAKGGKKIPGGEFRFEEFGKVFYLDNHLYSSQTNEKEKKFLSQLKVFEDHPVAGDGIATAFEIQKGEKNPRLWLYDNGELYPLELDLKTYLDTLLLTKGFFNWQYLFVNNFKKDDRYSIIKPQLSSMLEELQRLFPGENYELLNSKFLG